MMLNKYPSNANTINTLPKSSSVISDKKVNTSSPGGGRPQISDSDDSVVDYDLSTLDLTTIRISALTKAARISHLVTGKTIGPLSKKEKEEEKEREKCRNIAGTITNKNDKIPGVKKATKLSNWQHHHHHINSKPNTLVDENVCETDYDRDHNNHQKEQEESEHELNTKIKSIYYDQINSNIAMKLAERRRQELVKRELDAHNARYKMQDEKIAIDIANQLKLAREKLQLKREQQAQEIIDIGRKYDNESEECQKEYQQRMETHNKWIVEQTRTFEEEARIQREQNRVAEKLLNAAEESHKSETLNDDDNNGPITDKQKNEMNLYKYRDEFDINLKYYVEFLNTNAPLLTTEQYNEHYTLLNTYVDFFEKLRLELKQRLLTENDIEYLKKLSEMVLNGYTGLQTFINEILVTVQLEQQQEQPHPPPLQTEPSIVLSGELLDAQKPQQQQQRKQLKSQSQRQTTLPVQTDTIDSVITTNANGLSVRDDSDHVIYYCDVTDYYRLYEIDVRPLISDDSMKTFRFNCKKAINIPLNTISAVSAQHLQNKYDRLVTLLSGNYVAVGDTQFSANEHPLGIKYCKLLMAKKFVSQADSMVSSSPKSAYPIASVIVAIWQLHPDVGQLFLGFLYYENPSLVPLFIEDPETLFPNNSEAQFPRYLGYKSVDGQLETLDLFLKRLAGRTRLYAAVMITKTRVSNNLKHPHGLEYGWRWLTNALNIAPYRDLTATTLHEFLQVAGYDMWQVYGKQFSKILHYLHYQYLPELNKIDEGGPMARLQVLLLKIINEGKIDPPDGLLPINFW